MIDIRIDLPAHVRKQLNEMAASLDVTVEALVSYFFARGVVHT